MKIKNLTSDGVKETKPMSMVVHTRGKGRPHKNGKRKIKLTKTHVVVKNGHTYVHAPFEETIRSFGPGTEIEFK